MASNHSPGGDLSLLSSQHSWPRGPGVLASSFLKSSKLCLLNKEMYTLITINGDFGSQV